MSSLLKKGRPSHPGSIFVGEHPAVDFGNTQSLSQRKWIEHLRVWPDVVDWLSLAGLSTEPGLQISTSRSAEVVKSVLRLRDAWRSELAKLVEGGKVSADFVRQLNQNLEPDVFYETLQRTGKNGFQVVRTVSRLRGQKLALATLSRQIAHFLAQANFDYLHRCANTASCALYFYDTTKNHRRQWCSTAGCGNRHKVAEFRKRHGLLGNGT